MSSNFKNFMIAILIVFNMLGTVFLADYYMTRYKFVLENITALYFHVADLHERLNIVDKKTGYPVKPIRKGGPNDI